MGSTIETKDIPIPDGIICQWQNIVNTLANILNVPVFIIWSDQSWKEFEVESWPNNKFQQKFFSKEHFFQEFIEKIEEISKTIICD